jgi:hypothetical protein
VNVVTSRRDRYRRTTSLSRGPRTVAAPQGCRSRGANAGVRIIERGDDTWQVLRATTAAERKDDLGPYPWTGI